MALKTSIKEVEFGVGDRIRVHQKIKDGEKSRESIFEGIVIKIKGRGNGSTFTLRRIGEAGVGIEKIFPVLLPSIDKIAVVKKGVEGVKRAKLYYIREKSPSEIEMIFKKAAIRRAPKKQGSSKRKPAIKRKNAGKSSKSARK
jgi:large subunit ribosomal protein L19